jgi:membrane protease YdiL (CAAX protease family)
MNGAASHRTTPCHSDARAERGRKNLLHRHPVLTYFLATFSISWLGAFAVAAPYLLRHQPVPKLAGILMFPVMLVGPSLSSIVLTALLDGRSGLHQLFSRMRRISFPARWWAALLIPPVLIFTVLLSLRSSVSPAFTPGMFLMGIFFGIPAGFFEEIGWMGFAFPRMSQTRSPPSAGILLGLLWGLWHLPVVDFLGAASPHGRYLLPYFAAFTCAMTAIRVLIAWLYAKSGSVLLCQVMHACSTGSLVVFSPSGVNAAQETLWYFAYAALLWVVVAIAGTILNRNAFDTN